MGSYCTFQINLNLFSNRPTWQMYWTHVSFFVLKFICKVVSTGDSDVPHTYNMYMRCDSCDNMSLLTTYFSLPVQASARVHMLGCVQ